MAKKRIVTATVNGREEEFLCQPRQTLLEVLRNTLGLTGAKEGLAPVDGLDPLQEAFLENAALQCGICTPGFIMSAKAFLDENPNPTEEEIRFSMAGNLCRCTGYDKIVRAIQQAAETRCAQSASCEKETV